MNKYNVIPYFNKIYFPLCLCCGITMKENCFLFSYFGNNIGALNWGCVCSEECANMFILQNI